ncbi:unnamed protein product, partial [marine sediment metagenome]
QRPLQPKEQKLLETAIKILEDNGGLNTVLREQPRVPAAKKHNLSVVAQY